MPGRLFENRNVNIVLASLKLRRELEYDDDAASPAGQQEAALVQFEASNESLYACTSSGPEKSPDCVHYLLRSRHLNYKVQPRCKPCQDTKTNETRKRKRQQVALQQGRDYAFPKSNVSLKACDAETLAKRARALSKQVKSLENSRNHYKSRVATLEEKLRNYKYAQHGLLDLQDEANSSSSRNDSEDEETTIVQQEPPQGRHSLELDVPTTPASTATSSPAAPAHPKPAAPPSILMYPFVHDSQQLNDSTTAHI